MGWEVWDHMDLPYGVQNEIHVCKNSKTGNEEDMLSYDLWWSEKAGLEGQVSTYGRPWEVSVQLQKNKPSCPRLWQLSLLSCLPAEVPSFLILAALLTRDHPKAMLRLARAPRPQANFAALCSVGSQKCSLSSLFSPLLWLQFPPWNCLLSSVTLHLCLLPVKHSSRSWSHCAGMSECHSWLKPEPGPF